uniref:Rieske domain-containing protein n=1 Tax=Psilocybe cubensis TaxID=181762 RepID=A0A8H7Y0P8_PSICU
MDHSIPSASVDSVGKGDTGRILVIGMGMTALAFLENLFAYENDSGFKETTYWQVTVVGEEPWYPYNRVGLTQYFAHRTVADLYLQHPSWYSSHKKNRLIHITNDPVIHLDITKQQASTRNGIHIQYDICIFATGSHAAIPPYLSTTALQNTQGIYVYRTIEDLERMIVFAESTSIRNAAVIGGGLLGLEAAKALLDLDSVSRVTLIERNKWVLSRQLDEKGGNLVLAQVQSLGIEVLLETQVQCILTTKVDGNLVASGLGFKDGSQKSFDMIVFAIGITPRGELAQQAGIATDVRGGIIVKDDLRTSSPNVYAIGECASWKEESYGFIAPCIDMADILAYNLTRGPGHEMKAMTPPDRSTKLKLMGVNVASFGDYFADQKPLETVDIPGHRKHGKNATSVAPLRSLTYHDPFGPVYKKYIFTGDGKYLLGGMMVGDVNDYTKLISIIRKRQPLEYPPSQLILGIPRQEGESDGDDLDDNAQICSCYNVSKATIAKAIATGCKSFGEMKAKTKVSSGCGGCAPLATSIFNSEMKKAGHVIMNHICHHFRKSRQDLFMIVKVKKLTTFSEVMREAGEQMSSLGCEICKPAVASILSSLHNEFILNPVHRQNQDTNDKYLANIQRNGTYSVIPRVPAGEITPAKLAAIATVAEKYDLYTKITGAQRIDLLGAKKQDLPEIWEELGSAGFESGHAYGKALRTVKSCVGTSWCRFGVGDSVGLAIELEERYKGIRSPHKLKGGVSGCVRECAEAQSKDFGVIATSTGWNVYIGGNGGAKPRHAELIAVDVSKEKAVKIIDRFLMLYIQSADRLQRTARWVETLGEGGKSGLEYLKRVIIDDSLGICNNLDQAMEELVGTYFDEWAEVVRSPEKRALFCQFSNTEAIKQGAELIEERGQRRPPDWPEEATSLKFETSDIVNGHWKWRKVAKFGDLRPTEDASTSMVVNYSDTEIAIFRLANGEMYATQQMCPHRRAFVLSDGLVGESQDGKPYVSCPLHKKNFTLKDGQCLTDDKYKIMTFEVKVEGEHIYIKLPEPPAIDSVLGTATWMHRGTKEDSDYYVPSRVEIVAPSEEVEKIAEPRAASSTSVSCMALNKELDW